MTKLLALASIFANAEAVVFSGGGLHHAANVQ
jgi:hypothetical protein